MTFSYCLLAPLKSFSASEVIRHTCAIQIRLLLLLLLLLLLWSSGPLKS